MMNVVNITVMLCICSLNFENNFAQIIILLNNLYALFSFLKCIKAHFIVLDAKNQKYIYFCYQYLISRELRTFHSPSYIQEIYVYYSILRHHMYLQVSAKICAKYLLQ